MIHITIRQKTKSSRGYNLLFASYAALGHKLCFFWKAESLTECIYMLESFHAI